METNSDDVAGSLEGVGAAAEAGRRAAQPWWLIALEVLLVAGLWSMVYGGEQTWRNIALALVVFALPVVVLVVIAKRRERIGGFASGSRAAVVYWTGFFAAMFAGMISTKHLESGRPATYAAVFCVVVVLYGGCRVAAERIAVRPPS